MVPLVHIPKNACIGSTVLHSSRQGVLMRYKEPPLPLPQNCPFAWGIWIPYNAWFRLSQLPERHRFIHFCRAHSRDRQRYVPVCSNWPHLASAAMRRPNSTRHSSGDEIRTWTFQDDIFSHFYAVRPGSYRIRWNNAKWGLLCRSRSCKVTTDFSTNRKLIYDFMLVIDINVPPILHRFRNIAFDKSKIAIFVYPSCV